MEKVNTSTYNDKPCRSTEMAIGNTLFTVISVQSDVAKETAYNKVKKLILSGMETSEKSYLSIHS